MNLSELMAKKLPALGAIQQPSNQSLQPNQQGNREIVTYDAHGNSKHITLNDAQFSFSNMIASGASCCLIGAAGTGKTACTMAGISALIQTGKVPILTDISHKSLKAGNHGILICAFTRKATQNIKRQLSSDLQQNCITIHKTLEYSPLFIEYYDAETGETRKKRTFAPKRNLLNKLDHNIKTVIIEESSMLGTDLYHELLAALGDNVQFIFIGDINQLPPVFGHAILGYKLNQLPVIELTEVHRQALDSPILSLAHRILSGRPIISLEFNKLNVPRKLQFFPYHKRMDSETALLETLKMFYAAFESGFYNPDTDIILCPQTNDKSLKRYNCTLINKYLANHIAKKQGRITHEIICSFRKLYFSIGDRCLFDKQDCTIVDIAPNPEYIGVAFQEPSTNLDYFGHNVVEQAKLINTDINLDSLIALATDAIEEGQKQQSSHIITIKVDDNDEHQELKTIGDIGGLELAYAITIHKAQGSEWQKVFLLLHSSHNPMLKRELLYTAVTRAKESLMIVCELDSFVKGITSQAIKGTTLAEKAIFFRGKVPVNKTLAIEDIDNIGE